MTDDDSYAVQPQLYSEEDADGIVHEYRTREEAETAARRTAEARRAEQAEIDADNATIRAKPTAADRAMVEQLPPGLHLSVDEVSGRRPRRMFFRCISEFVYFVVALVMLLFAIPVTVAAWCSLLVTERYPTALFAYNRSLVRFCVRLYGYTLMVTDVRPPLSGGMAPQYPIRVEVAAQPTYNRWLAAFRLPLLLPLAVANGLAIVLGIVTVVLGYPIVSITKHQLRPLQAAAKFAMRVYGQFLCSSLLLTETFWISTADRGDLRRRDSAHQSELPEGRPWTSAYRRRQPRKTPVQPSNARPGSPAIVDGALQKRHSASAQRADAATRGEPVHDPRTLSDA